MRDVDLPDPPERNLTDHELDALLTRSQHKARTAVTRTFDLEAGLRRAIIGQPIEARLDGQNLYVTSRRVIASHSVGATAIADLQPVGTLATAIRPVEEPGSAALIRPRSGPTVLRTLVGAQLRRLREACGITREEAGYAIRASHSKISRLELGRTGFKTRDVDDLLTLYGITNEIERASLLTLAKQANTPGWWRAYDDVVPAWFEHFLGLEQAAAVIRSYVVQFVPALLQTTEYARAVIRLGNPDDTSDQIDRRVDLYAKRQQILRRPDPPKVWAVIDEAALRRPIGSTPTMRAQLEHLIEIADLPHVTVQVLPFSVGGHAAAGGPITILRFTEDQLPDVVYLEQLISALYLEKPQDVDRYLAVMERLSMDAEPPPISASILSQILEDL